MSLPCRYRAATIPLPAQGSAPKPIASSTPDAPSLASITPVKPIDGFCARWDVILARVLASDDTATSRIVVVGGGAGGVELALSMQARNGAVTVW